jgi:hypothetical protein
VARPARIIPTMAVLPRPPTRRRQGVLRPGLRDASPTASRLRNNGPAKPTCTPAALCTRRCASPSPSPSAQEALAVLHTEREGKQQRPHKAHSLPRRACLSSVVLVPGTRAPLDRRLRITPPPTHCCAYVICDMWPLRQSNLGIPGTPGKHRGMRRDAETTIRPWSWRSGRLECELQHGDRHLSMAFSQSFATSIATRSSPVSPSNGLPTPCYPGSLGAFQYSPMWPDIDSNTTVASTLPRSLP